MRPKTAYIRSEPRDNLMISRDTGDANQPIAVLLYTPKIGVFDHHHIELDRDQCVALRAWLNEFLMEVDS